MWDKRYSEPGYAYGTRENDFLASVAERLPAGRVLCLGEGEGRNAVYLAERGYDVTAVDASSVGIDKTLRLASDRDVSVRAHVADLADFAIEESAWNGIVSIFCHLPSDVRQAVHRRSVEGLAAGGAFVLEGFTPRQLGFSTGGPSHEDLMMSLADLRRELDGLDFEIAHEIDREVLEGRYHTGLSAVVQILAIRR